MSIVVACRNEGSHIAILVQSILAQDIPFPWEAILADGMSDDGTAEYVRNTCRLHRQFRFVANPERIVSTALNRAIRAAQGTYIIRMDAHTRYREDYCRESIEALIAHEADNAGGAARTEANGGLGHAIAAAFHSRFSTGGACFHDEKFEGWVDTVPYGCWRKATLERIGLFDPRLVRNQDDELNLRLRLAGGRIWQDRRIVSWYTPRASLSALFRQYMQYGFWKVAVVRKHHVPARWRQFVPALFVGGNAGLGLCLLGMTAFDASSTAFSMTWKAWVLEVGAYLTASLIASVAAARREGWGVLPYLPIVFLAYHVSYGIGFIAGMLSSPVAVDGNASEARWFARVTR